MVGSKKSSSQPKIAESSNGHSQKISTIFALTVKQDPNSNVVMNKRASQNGITGINAHNKLNNKKSKSLRYVTNQTSKEEINSK